MTPETQKAFDVLEDAVQKAALVSSMANVIGYDMETVCPPKGREKAQEQLAWLSDRTYEVTHSQGLTDALGWLNAHTDELDANQKALVWHWTRETQLNRNVTPSLNHEAALTFGKAFDVWVRAKKAKDYSLFKDQLAANVAMTKRLMAVRDNPEGLSALDWAVDDLEHGMRVKDLDAYFSVLKAKLVPLIHRVYASPVKIRDDFLARPVPKWQQEAFSRWLMEELGFDFSRGALGETEHPFTNYLGKGDERIATHYYETNFIDNVYSICHETGHGLFGQNQPKDQVAIGLVSYQTYDMDESVSRFYENNLGRSEAFIERIFPKMAETFAPVLDDVSPREFYLAANKVYKQPIRTAADELTYSLHIVIRFEIEKGLFDGTLSVDSLDKVWNQKYKDYLDVDVRNDAEGILQDVHWTDSFGYFPVYAVGNGYNAAYGKALAKAMEPLGGLDEVLRHKPLTLIRDWMAANVFAKANLLPSKEWIKAITGKPLQSDDFVAYLTQKYSAIFRL